MRGMCVRGCRVPRHRGYVGEWFGVDIDRMDKKQIIEFFVSDQA